MLGVEMTMLSNMTQGSSADHSTVDYSLIDFSDGPRSDSKPWDTSDPYISASTRDLMDNVMRCYIRQPIAFIGIPGNILCCAVFLKQGLSDRINLLLFWLAVADLASLIGQLMLMPRCYIVDPTESANWGVIISTYIGGINWWLTFVSGTLMLFLSVDRCLSVVVPFKAKRLLQYSFTAAAVIVAYLLPLAFTILGFLAVTVRWRTDPSTNRSAAYMDATTWFPMNSRVAFDLKAYFLFITRPVFLVIMIICCTITIFHLRRASRTRVKMGGNVTEEGKSGDNRITVMLLVICVAYIILTIPQIGFSITVMFIPDYNVYRRYHNSVVVHYQFIWIGSCLNSAINFIPYLLLSSRFQRTLKDLCFCLGTKPHSNLSG